VLVSSVSQSRALGFDGWRERVRFVRLDECIHAEGEPNVFRAGCEYGLDLDADIVLDISGEIEAERDR
jgi:hypothetical protein